MIRKRKSFLLPILSIVFPCLVLAVFTTVGVLEQTAETIATNRELPIYCVKTEEKKIALTFDAAWGNSDTDVLIDLLKTNDVKATFFATGEWAEKFPDDVKKLHEAGHEIQNHSDTHPHPNSLSYAELVNDTAACSEKIYALTGIYPTLYRTPYGEYNDSVIRTIKSLAMLPIQWDVDSLDWKDPSPQEINNRVLATVGAGSILLFHNDAKNTPEALKTLLPELKKQGYSFVTVSSLIPQGTFSLNYEGRLIPDGK